MHTSIPFYPYVLEIGYIMIVIQEWNLTFRNMMRFPKMENNFHNLKLGIMNMLWSLPYDVQQVIFYEYLDIRSRYTLKHTTSHFLKDFFHVNVCSFNQDYSFDKKVLTILPHRRSDAYLEVTKGRNLVYLNATEHHTFHRTGEHTTPRVWYEYKGRCVIYQCGCLTRKGPKRVREIDVTDKSKTRFKKTMVYNYHSE